MSKGQDVVKRLKYILDKCEELERPSFYFIYIFTEHDMTYEMLVEVFGSLKVSEIYPEKYVKMDRYYVRPIHYASATQRDAEFERISKRFDYKISKTLLK